MVAQLVKRSLPTPEIRGSNPVIGKIYIECLLSSVLIRRKLIKEAENGPLKTMAPYCSVRPPWTLWTKKVATLPWTWLLPILVNEWHDVGLGEGP